MSRGEIVDNKGEGLYTVKLKYAVERVQQELVRINQRIAELAIAVPEAKLARLEKENEIKAAESELDGWIDLYGTDKDAARAAVIEGQQAIIRLVGELAQLDFKVDELIAEDLSLKKRRGQLEAIPEDKTLDAWCADYSEELTGDVGLIDINDEGDNGVIIQPGYDEMAEYLPDRDGMLMHREAQSGAQVWFNAAILPGMQKWFPRYRVGEITDISQDMCSVQLDDAFSSAQDLDITKEPLLEGVPIYYMDCNGEVFEEGDRVVVRFTQSGPLVVGFEKEPRACFFPGVSFQPARLDFTNIDWVNRRGITRTSYGAPYQSESGAEINYPLGTEGGRSSWVATPTEGQFDIHRGRNNQYGPGTWVGADGSVLSWKAPPGRLHEAIGNSSNRDWFPEVKIDWIPGSDVFYRGRSINHGIPNALVMGAAFYMDGGGQEWLRVFSSQTLYQVQLDRSRKPIAPPQTVAEYNRPINTEAVSGWYFSASGNKAVCTFKTTDDSPQKRIVARFDGGSITDEIVYNQDDVIGQSSIRTWATLQTTEIDDNNNLYDYSIGDEQTDNRQQYSIPLYYDFNGNSEVEVRLEKPLREIDEEWTVEGFRDEESNEEAYTETYTRTATYAADRIITSNGELIAQLPESGSSISDSGTLSYNPTDLASMSGSSEQSGRDVSYVLRAIDARFSACVVEILELESSFSGSGQITQGQFGLSIAGSGSSMERSYEALFVGGQKRDEIEVYSETTARSSRYMDISLVDPQGRWGNYDSTNYFDITGAVIVMDQRPVIDFIGYQSGGSEFYSANMTVFFMDQGYRLMHKTGGGNIIDQALAKGDDVFLLNPGIK